jgi:hypothetical protein
MVKLHLFNLGLLIVASDRNLSVSVSVSAEISVSVSAEISVSAIFATFGIGRHFGLSPTKILVLLCQFHLTFQLIF